MKVRGICIFWILLALSASIGQVTGTKQTVTGSIVGRVTESATGNPIAGANVLVLGTMLGAATDGEGRFIIPYITPGSYTIMVSAIGYKKEEKDIRVLRGREVDLAFVLEETVVLLDGVAVTASRYQQSVNDIPVSLSLVPAHELSERNILSVDQALRYVPGVNALDGGQVTIRGSSGFNWGVGSRVLVLLNGSPFMAGDMHNVNWYAIPTSNVKQIEVMKGSGSALYGSSAMGGVINIITDEPKEGSHIYVRTFTGLYSRPSHTQWQWADERNHFEGTAVDFSTYVGPVSTVFSSNYHATTGYRENDDRQVFNFMATLGYPFSHRLRTDLMAGYGRNKGGFFIYWKDLAHPYDNGSDPIGYHTRSTMQNTFAYPSISYIVNDKMNLLLKGRYNKASSEDHLQNKVDGGTEGEDAFRSSRVTTHGGEAQLNCQVTSQGILVVGYDVQHDEVESIQFDDRRASRSSYYVQFDQRFWGILKTTVGARYDWEKVQGIGSTGEVTRKLGMNLTLGPATNLRFSAGEGFRVPAIAERFISTFTAGIRLSPNPDLRPEKSKSLELGIKQALSRSMNLDAAVFYNEYEDLIEPQLYRDADQAGVTVRFQNVLQARVLGFDVSHRTDWWSRLLSTRIGYSYIDSKDLSPGDEYGAPLKYRSKHMVYVSNDMNYPPLSFGIDLRYLSRIERVDEYHKVFIKDIDARVPTYVTALRFGFTKEHFTLRFLIDNLFQYNYLISPANMAPPRTATIQLDVRY